MPRPLLLIVDGESILTPSLLSALEGDGWVVQRIRSAEAQAFLDQSPEPDLMLLDESVAGEAGYAVARRLRERKPGLPLLVMAQGTAGGTVPKRPSGEVQGFLERTQTEIAIMALLRKHRPDATKYTTDDIFGDLLADLEREEAPVHQDAFTIFTEPAVLAGKHAARPPMAADDIFGPVLHEVEAHAVSVPERKNLPTSSVTLAPARKTEPPPAAPRSEAEPLAPADFTLSGISGVKDPFEWADASPVLPPSTPAPSTPAPSIPAPSIPAPSIPAPASVKQEAPGTSQPLEEYGNYFLLEKIAVGGMAELFKAQQRGVQGFQKIVAIKRILPHFSDNEDFVTMFIDEAKLAAQLTHPNIVQIFDLGKAGSSYYIAMEYVNGRDLRTMLKKVREYGTPIPEQVAAFVVMKVAAALDYAHRKRGFDDRELKLVHRDISPQNILVSTEGAVKLVDFGIAKAASKASHTVAGALKGKLLYMSPEQATGQPLDNRSDLYSLGLVLFELLTGERCFQADSELGVLEKVRLGRISDLAFLNPNVSKEIAAIVSRALQKGVDHRYPSARFMERDLREYLQRQGPPITEHDVAEYLTALLKGDRERLATLISTKFPAPTNLVTGSHRVLSDASVAQKVSGDYTSTRTAAALQTPTSDQVTRTQSPLSTIQEGESTRPSWLLPVILAVAVILVIMLAVAAWS